MKLYGEMASPYVTRVIMYAHLKGVDLSRAPVPGGNPRTPEYRLINPVGKVPGLDLGDGLIPESEVICEYLEDAYPERSGLPGCGLPTVGFSIGDWFSRPRNPAERRGGAASGVRFPGAALRWSF